MAAYYTFEDYSGTSTPNKTDNPYDGLIDNCNNDPVGHPFESVIHIIDAHTFTAPNPNQV